MQLTDRALNRTLWLRQGLVPDAPLGLDALGIVEHLIGLQAQENLPPYLALAARVPGFDPHELSTALEERRAVRLLTLRGTIHVLTPADALALRPWVQPMLDQVSRTNEQSRPAAMLATADLDRAARAELADGPLPVADLGARLASAFPDVPADAVRHVARERLPLLQVPPRGLWRRAGGPVLQLADTWLGAPFARVELPELVRRYLRAYGPARAADMTTWSRVTRLGPVFAAMPDLVTHTDATGRTMYDVADAPFADADLDLPVRMLGTYDNVAFSHADRSRIADDASRARLMGPNGVTGAMLYVDGMLAGSWRAEDGRIVVTGFREFTRVEQRGVTEETARIEAFLARD